MTNKPVVQSLPNARWGNTRMAHDVEPPQPEESAWRIGTETPPTETDAVRGPPVLVLTTSVISPELAPLALPETVSHPGRPERLHPHPTSVWMMSFTWPPEAASPRSFVLTAYEQEDPEPGVRTRTRWLLVSDR